jgi:hypothetical protein
MNKYGFGAGDPINYSDPFGLCKGPKGEKRPCKVELSAEGRGVGTKLENLRPEVLKKLQELADAADVDLGINFTTNGRHTDPGHAAGTAVDIGEINGDDIGDGKVTYPGMMELSQHVQSVAGRLGGLKSDPPFSGNLGPSGKFYGAEGPFRINTQRTREGHMNHIHLSYIIP